jgi:hypothetical protein
MNDSSSPIFLVDVWIVPGKKGLSMVKGGTSSPLGWYSNFNRLISCNLQPRVKTTCILTL